MTLPRRDFLKTAGALSLAGALGGWRPAAAAVERGDADTAFGFADDRVPMNAANLCPMPTAISDAVADFAHALDRDLSAANRRRIEAMKEDARAGLALQLGVSPDELAIVRNTSEANSIVVQGVPLGRGDEVLLWEQNHPTNALAWDVRARRDGFTVRRFAVPANAQSIEEVLARITNALGRATRVVSFTHISNISGFRLPAAEICAALRRKRPGLFIHIDGAQTWGVRDVDLGRLGCDSFSGSAHKWFMGPRETGLLYVSEARIDELAATVVGIPWGNDVEPSVAGARKYEALGQRDDAAIAALAETVALHARLTPAAVAARAGGVAAELRAALVDLGVPLVSPTHPEFASNVLIIRTPRVHLDGLPQRILELSGVITAPVGGLRMSPHLYNTSQHVERVAAAIKASRHLFAEI